MNVQEIIRDLRLRIFSSLGLAPVIDEQSVEDLQKKTEIPQEYLDRFSLDPLIGSKAFINRTEEVNLLKQAHENWQISQYLTLLVGEAGMGITSLLNYLKEEIHPEAIIIPDGPGIHTHSQLVKLMVEVLGLQKASTLQEIEEQLDETPRVIILENLERLFLRRIHGFDLLRDFLLFMHSTKKCIYWICTTNKYSYYYLEQSIDISANFLTIIRLKNFKEEDVKEVLAQRNEEYEVLYLKPASITRTMNWQLRRAQLGEKQVILEKHFFNRLYSYSQGNISRSIIFWLNSIVRINEKKIYMRLFEPKLLGDVPVDELFILEVIMQHTTLSSKSLDLILRQGKRSGPLALEHLLAKKWVKTREYIGQNKSEYEINLMYLKELKQLMRNNLNRNI